MVNKSSPKEKKLGRKTKAFLLWFIVVLNLLGFSTQMEGMGALLPFGLAVIATFILLIFLHLDQFHKH